MSKPAETASIAGHNLAQTANEAVPPRGQPVKPRGMGNSRRRERANQQAAMAASNPEALLLMESVEALTGMCRSLIYAKESAGLFPPAIRIGTRFTRWRAGDVKAFLDAQAKGV
jgi:prophage regulatory protein